jgi:hypothetical protein
MEAITYPDQMRSWGILERRIFTSLQQDQSIPHRCSVGYSLSDLSPTLSFALPEMALLRIPIEPRNCGFPNESCFEHPGMSDPEPEAKSPLPPNVTLILAIGILALLGYQVYNGLVFQEIGFGPFVIKLGTRASQPSENGAPAPGQSPAPEAQKPLSTREFFVGRWRWQSESEPSSSDEKFFENGVFTGSLENLGLARPISGHWNLTTLDNNMFRLTMNYRDGTQWQRNFMILDQKNHIQNIDQNYVAVRVGP